MAENEKPLNNSSDMEIARLVFNKLDETLENFHSRALPILSLSEQLSNLQSSLESVGMINGVSLLKEDNLVVCDDSLMKLEKFKEDSLVVVCEGCREIREREKRVKLREVELDKFSLELDLKEKRVEEEFRDCFEELREQLIESRRVQCEEIELKLEELGKRWKDLEVKEKEIKKGLEGLRRKERAVLKEGKVSVVRKRKDCSGFSGVKVKRGRTNGGCVGRNLQGLSKVIESRLKEGWGVVGLKGGESEKEVSEGFREMELKERVVNEECNAIEMKEMECNAIEMKETECNAIGTKKVINEECNDLRGMELKKKVVNEESKAIDTKKMECKAVEMKVMVGKAIEMKKVINECNDIRAMELKKRVRNEDRKRVKLRNEELEIVEKQTNDSVGALELKVKELEEGCEGVERKHCLAMELREKQLNEGLEGIKTKLKQLYVWQKKMEVKKREVNESYQKVKVREKQVERRKRVLELREQSLNVCCQAQVSKEKVIDEKCSAIEFKVKQLNEQGQALMLLEKDLDQRCQSLNLQEKEVSSIYKAKVVIEKELQDKLRVLELKEKQLSDAGNNNLGSEDRIFRLCKAMSGKTLQILLNELFMEHNSMMTNLCNALKVSSDPAKLVLSAVYGFFPPHLERGGGLVFDTSAVRSSCIVLLESLMNMNALISETVKEEAMKVASQWKEAMMAEGVTSFVVKGFLLLLAAYNLESKFETRELKGLYEVIGQDRLAPQIGLRLGLSIPKNDAQSDSKHRKKRSGTSTEPQGQEKQPRLVSDQRFTPYHSTGPMCVSPANGGPFQCQYPVWPPTPPSTPTFTPIPRPRPRPTPSSTPRPPPPPLTPRPIPIPIPTARPTACNCIPPFWCFWCRPFSYSNSRISQ